MKIREWTWEDTRQMIIKHQGWDPGTEEEAKARIAMPMKPSKREEAFLSVLPVDRPPPLHDHCCDAWLYGWRG